MMELSEMVRSLRKASDEGTIKLTAWEDEFIKDMSQSEEVIHYTTRYASYRQADKIREIHAKHFPTAVPTWKKVLKALWALRWIIIPAGCILGSFLAYTPSDEPPPPACTCPAPTDCTVEEAYLWECSQFRDGCERQYSDLEQAVELDILRCDMAEVLRVKNNR